MRPRRFLSTLLLTLLCGCKTATMPVPVIDPEPLPLRITIFPSENVLSYVTIRVNCMLPAGTGDGAYAFGIVDLFKSTGPIDKLQYSRELVAPCEPFTVFCAYQEVGSEIKQVVRTITPIGECR